MLDQFYVSLVIKSIVGGKNNKYSKPVFIEEFMESLKIWHYNSLILFYVISVILILKYSISLPKFKLYILIGWLIDWLIAMEQLWLK